MLNRSPMRYSGTSPLVLLVVFLAAVMPGFSLPAAPAETAWTKEDSRELSMLFFMDSVSPSRQLRPRGLGALKYEEIDKILGLSRRRQVLKFVETEKKHTFREGTRQSLNPWTLGKALGSTFFAVRAYRKIKRSSSKAVQTSCTFLLKGLLRNPEAWVSSLLGVWTSIDVVRAYSSASSRDLEMEWLIGEEEERKRVEALGYDGDSKERNLAKSLAELQLRALKESLEKELEKLNHIRELQNKSRFKVMVAPEKIGKEELWTGFLNRAYVLVELGSLPEFELIRLKQIRSPSVEKNETPSEIHWEIDQKNHFRLSDFSYDLKSLEKVLGFGAPFDDDGGGHFVDPELLQFYFGS